VLAASPADPRKNERLLSAVVLSALVGPRRDGLRGRQPDSGLAPRASITPWR